MEARKIIGSAVLAAWALILSAGTAAGQYKSKIDVLKGEKWWGVFVTGEQMMPLEKPFPQTRPVDMGQESSDPFPRFEQGTLYMEPRAVQDRVHGKRLSDRLAGRAGRGRDGWQDASGGLSGMLSPQFSAEGR